MPRFDIKLGIKNIDGDAETRTTIEHVIREGSMGTVVGWISEKLAQVKGTIENIFHLEIYERD